MQKLLALALILISTPLPAREFRVTRGESGDGQSIVTAVKQAIADGGGEVIIGPGEYLIHAPIVLKAARDLVVRGEPGAVLKLAPMAYGEVAIDAKPGETTLKLTKAKGFRAGQQVRIMAPGEIHPFTGKATPHFHLKATHVETDAVHFEKPLQFPVPAGTAVLWGDEPNLIEINGAAANVVIESLTLEGDAGAGTPQIATHNTRSALWVTGDYDYEKGPKGPKPKGIVVRDCQIRSFHGRGAAFYSAEDCIVERCIVERTLEEAIDFDHFADRCIARQNVLRDCRLGVEINDANDCLVERNQFVGGLAGVRIWRWCKMPELNVRNRINENLFDVGKYPAIEMLGGTAQNIASGNVVVVPAGKKMEDLLRDKGEGNQLTGNEARPQPK
jgi:hypothetical protein